MSLAIAVCHCSVCRNPAGDDAIQALHSDRHLAFERFRGDRPDWHGFRAPSPAAMVRMAAGEWSVPPGCPRIEHTGAPQHPRHLQGRI